MSIIKPNIKEYLSSIDCLVITTKLNENRYRRTEENCGHLFKSIKPYYAYDVSSPSVESKFALLFKEGSSNLEKSIKELGTNSLKPKSLVSFGTKKLTPKMTTKYARTESLFLTHKDILNKIVTDNKPYVVIEDDAHIREEVLDFDIELPSSFDILVLGGQTNHTTDNKQFAEMISPFWGNVTNTTFNGHGAYATIYTPFGALKTIEALNKLHTHVDFARKPALCEWTDTKKIVPDLFTVRGASVRDLNIKEDNRALTQKEARDNL